MTLPDERQLDTAVAGLQVEVRDLRQAVERSADSLADVREDFQRMRGEMNGILPRLEGKIERVIEQLDGRADTEREYFEKVRVHDQELQTLSTQVATKAEAEGNRSAHDRLWLALRLFFYGTLIALVALLLERTVR